ncbi:MAG: phosphonate ABC transporter, permease protein PhnE [Pseudomonadota bacterium]
MPAVLPQHLQLLEDELHVAANRRRIYTWIGIAVTVLTVYVGVSIANEQNATPFSHGFVKIFDYPIDMMVEAWESGWKWPDLVVKHFPDLLATLNMAFFSTFLGFCFGAVLACFASRNLISSPLIVGATRRLLDLMRSFPELVIAMVLLFLMGKNLLPAVIAITIHTTGVLGKLFSEAIENIDNKPIEGLQSVGANWTSRIFFGVLPQVLPLFFSYAMLRLEINVRASTILGFVGAGGIGEALSTVIQWRYGAEIMAIMFLLVVTITSLDYLSSYIRRRVIEG